jgi:hypothetical protein
MARVKDTNRVDPREVYQYLREKGVSDNHAIGMLANIKHESGFNPTAIGDKGTSIGLFQHHASRAESLKKFAGSSWQDWRKQVDFALQEKGTYNFLKSDFKTPEEASEWWTIKWEVPSNKYEKAKQRAKSIPEMVNLIGVDYTPQPYEQNTRSQTQEINGSEFEPQIQNTYNFPSEQNTFSQKAVMQDSDGNPFEVDIEEIEREVEKIGKVEEKLDKSEDRQEIEQKKQDRINLFKEFGLEAKGIVPYRTKQQELQDQQERTTGYEIQEIEVQRSLPEMPNLFYTNTQLEE